MKVVVSTYSYTRYGQTAAFFYAVGIRMCPILDSLFSTQMFVWATFQQWHVNGQWTRVIIVALRGFNIVKHLLSQNDT